MLRPLQKALKDHPNARSLVEVASRVNNLNAIPHPPNRRFGPKFTRIWRAFDINKRDAAPKPDTSSEKYVKSDRPRGRWPLNTGFFFKSTTGRQARNPLQ
jgi:hypothetical protein